MLNLPCLENGLRVVIDTNVVLSLWVFTDNSLAPLRSEINAGRWTILTNPPCLDEFRRVLDYPEFGLDQKRQAAIFQDYEGLAQQWSDTTKRRIPLPTCKDLDDQKFLELARDSGAQCLITRDKALLKLARRKRLAGLFQIVQPEDLLAARESPAQ